MFAATTMTTATSATAGTAGSTPAGATVIAPAARRCRS